MCRAHVSASNVASRSGSQIKIKHDLTVFLVRSVSLEWWKVFVEPACSKLGLVATIPIQCVCVSE